MKVYGFKWKQTGLYTSTHDGRISNKYKETELVHRVLHTVLLEIKNLMPTEDFSWDEVVPSDKDGWLLTDSELTKLEDTRDHAGVIQAV